MHEKSDFITANHGELLHPRDQTVYSKESTGNLSVWLRKAKRCAIKACQPWVMLQQPLDHSELMRLRNLMDNIHTAVHTAMRVQESNYLDMSRPDSFVLRVFRKPVKAILKNPAHDVTTARGGRYRQKSWWPVNHATVPLEISIGHDQPFGCIRSQVFERL